MQKGYRALFILIMICAVLTVLWYIPASLSISFRTDEVAKDLDTSLKREEKQRYEYDQVITELPLIREQLAEKEPLAQEATEKIAALKAERKRLRAEKKDLESALAENPATSVDPAETEELKHE